MRPVEPTRRLLDSETVEAAALLARLDRQDDPEDAVGGRGERSRVDVRGVKAVERRRLLEDIGGALHGVGDEDRDRVLSDGKRRLSSFAAANTSRSWHFR